MNFPTTAELARREQEELLKQRIEELKQKQVSADTGAEKKAIEVGIGKIIEKVLPAYKNFTLPLADCRFISEPIDIVVFYGSSQMKTNHITFMDVKTGNSKLNTHQRMVRDAIKENRVTCEVI